jgi:2-polyprenyl-6-methoxyphenol hydroxylase-like FAD-dependent oxidoreductase
MRVMIIGAGIGGLSLAIALRRVGIEATTFEKAPAFRAVGAGLTLWTNAMLALDQMGAGEAVRSVAAPVERGEVRSWLGKLIAAMPIGEISRSLGASTVALHRADLHAALFKTLPPNALRSDSEFAGFAREGTEVVARFKDGREERGDLLVGADGIKSVLRSQLLGQAPLRYSGYVGWQAATLVGPAIDTPGLRRLFIGRGTQFGIVPIGGGRVYWFGTLNLPEGSAAGPWGP